MTDEIGGRPTPAELEVDAASVVEREWGRRPSRVRRVSSDVEETFLVEFEGAHNSDPARAVLKIAEPGRDPEWFAFEAAIVEHALASDAHLPLARGIPTPGGALIVGTAFGGSARIARLMHHLPGMSASDAKRDAAAHRRIGRTAGRLSRALASATHTGASRRVPWDLRDLGGLADGIRLVPDARARVAVGSALSAHAELLRAAEHLPAQISHNDLNGGNILVSPDDPGTVTGIIDFGDAAQTTRAFDVGIAAAYAGAEAARASAARSPWAAAASFTAGYADVVALTADELALVPAIARARLAQRVLIAAARRDVAASTPTRDDVAWLMTAQRDLLALTEAEPADAADAPKEWR